MFKEGAFRPPQPEDVVFPVQLNFSYATDGGLQGGNEGALPGVDAIKQNMETTRRVEVDELPFCYDGVLQNFRLDSPGPAPGPRPPGRPPGPTRPEPTEPGEPPQPNPKPAPVGPKPKPQPTRV